MSNRSFFGNRKGKKSQSQYKRTLSLESLEERALLSAAPLSTSEYADLRPEYAEFNLSENMANLNVLTLDLAPGDGQSQLNTSISTDVSATQPLNVDSANGNYLGVNSQAIDNGSNSLMVDANGLSPNIEINGRKVTVFWEDDSSAADSVRYRAAGTTRWTTVRLRPGVTLYAFNAKPGTSYEIEVLLDQKEDNVLQGSATVLDQPKLSIVKNELKDDTFQVNVTNYTAKNLAENAQKAIVTVNGVKTELDIVNQQGAAALTDGSGQVSFSNGLFTFTEMTSNTFYKVQVSFSDGNSESLPSPVLPVKTLKAPYLAPEITSATAVSDSSITVEWETAYGKNSDIAAQRYTVQYSTDGEKWKTATMGATGNSYTIQRLKGGVDYQVRVIATRDFSFESSEPSDVLTAEPLAFPKVTVDRSSVTDESFQLKVVNYEDSNLVEASTLTVKSDKYGEVQIALQDGSGSGTFENGMTATFENGALTFANASSNTLQKIQLNFSKDECTTAWSAPLTIKTSKTCYQAPVITSATAVSDSSITVEWETAYGKDSEVAAQRYTVQFSTDGERWITATTGATGNSYTIQRLWGGVEYQVRVIATRDFSFDSSAPSNVLTAEPLAFPIAIVKMFSVEDDAFQLKVVNYEDSNLVSASTLTVKSDKYGEVQIALQDGSGSRTFENGMTATFENGALTFANAPSNTLQKIQLNFSKDACTTAWSVPLTIKTLTPRYTKPVLTNATAVSRTSIEVEWEPVLGKNSTTEAQKYTVQFSTNGVRWFNASTSVTETSYTITNLRPNTKYLVAVIANRDSEFGASLPSDSEIVTTLS